MRRPDRKRMGDNVDGRDLETRYYSLSINSESELEVDLETSVTSRLQLYQICSTIVKAECWVFSFLNERH